MWNFVSGSIVDGVVTGLPFAMVFLGVWSVFRLQNNFDLTVDGSMSVGGAVMAAWVLQGGNPWVGLLLAAGCGSACGLLTYTIMSRLQISLVLTSIVVGLGLYSVALWFMGQPDISIVGAPNIFTTWSDLTGLAPRSSLAVASFAAILVGVVYLLMARFLRSEFGLSLRAAGENPIMARAMGISPAVMLMICIILGNVLAALSGAVLAEQQGFADVTMGTGAILFGITAVLLGEVATGGWRAGHVSVVPVLVGALLYYTLLAGAYRAGVPPQFFQGMTAIIVLISLAIGRLFAVTRDRREASRAQLQFAAQTAGNALGGSAGALPIDPASPVSDDQGDHR